MHYNSKYFKDFTNVKEGDKFLCVHATPHSTFKVGEIYTVVLWYSQYYLSDKSNSLYIHNKVTSACFVRHEEEKPVSKWKSTNKAGNPVIIYTENGKGDYPIVGQYQTTKGDWHSVSWTSTGRHMMNDPSGMDLIPEVDIDKFYDDVICDNRITDDGSDLYKRARQWFIDHPEELK